MTIKYIKTNNPILQKYIEGYYFLIHSEFDLPVKYITFPNNNCILTVSANVETLFAENEVVIKEKKGGYFNSDLICHYIKPITVSYEGNIDEITFVFKPLGLNSFLDKPLNQYSSDFFSNFNPFDDYNNQMTTIIREIDVDNKRQMIEDYWLSKLIGFNHPFLNELLIDIQDGNSITKLAAKYNISRQNLSKHFEVNLCKSPSDFKKIQRFRNALNLQINSKTKNNLSALTYDVLFYDQSHLIKDFKSLTGLTPKEFFKNLTTQDEKINWLFV